MLGLKYQEMRIVRTKRGYSGSSCVKEKPEARRKRAYAGTKQEEPGAQGSLGGRLGEMTGWVSWQRMVRAINYKPDA